MFFAALGTRMGATRGRARECGDAGETREKTIVSGVLTMVCYVFEARIDSRRASRRGAGTRRIFGWELVFKRKVRRGEHEDETERRAAKRRSPTRTASSASSPASCARGSRASASMRKFSSQSRPGTSGGGEGDGHRAASRDRDRMGASLRFVSRSIPGMSGPGGERRDEEDEWMWRMRKKVEALAAKRNAAR